MSVKKSKKATSKNIKRQSSLPDSQAQPDQSSTSSRRRKIIRAIAGFIVGSAGVISCVMTIPFVSRHLNSGQLEVSIGNDVALNQDSPTYFFFRVPPDKADALFVLPISFRVTNASDTHDDNIVISVKYDKKFQRSFFPEESFKRNPSRPAKEQQYELSQRNEFDYVNYSLSFLSPHDHQGFTEGAFATRIPYDPAAPLLHSARVGLDVTIDTYSQQDIRRSWNIRYRGLLASKNADIPKVLMEWYTKQIALEIRERSGFWGYIPKLISQREVVMYFYEPNFLYFPEPNIFSPSSIPEHIFGIKVVPYSWELLF